jgi:hypothetical protein
LDLLTEGEVPVLTATSPVGHGQLFFVLILYPPDWPHPAAERLKGARSRLGTSEILERRLSKLIWYFGTLRLLQISGEHQIGPEVVNRIMPF